MSPVKSFHTTPQGGGNRVGSGETGLPHFAYQGGEQVGKNHRNHTPHHTSYGVWGVVRKGSAESSGGEKVRKGWGMTAWQGCRTRLRALRTELNNTPRHKGPHEHQTDF